MFVSLSAVATLWVCQSLAKPVNWEGKPTYWKGKPIPWEGRPIDREGKPIIPWEPFPIPISMGKTSVEKPATATRKDTAATTYTTGGHTFIVAAESHHAVRIGEGHTAITVTEGSETKFEGHTISIDSKGSLVLLSTSTTASSTVTEAFTGKPTHHMPIPSPVSKGTTTDVDTCTETGHMPSPSPTSNDTAVDTTTRKKTEQWASATDSATRKGTEHKPKDTDANTDIRKQTWRTLAKETAHKPKETEHEHKPKVVEHEHKPKETEHWPEGTQYWSKETEHWPTKTEHKPKESEHKPTGIEHKPKETERKPKQSWHTLNTETQRKPTSSPMDVTHTVTVTETATGVCAATDAAHKGIAAIFATWKQTETEHKPKGTATDATHKSAATDKWTGGDSAPEGIVPVKARVERTATDKDHKGTATDKAHKGTSTDAESEHKPKSTATETKNKPKGTATDTAHKDTTIDTAKGHKATLGAISAIVSDIRTFTTKTGHKSNHKGTSTDSAATDKDTATDATHKSTNTAHKGTATDTEHEHTGTATETRHTGKHGKETGHTSQQGEETGHTSKHSKYSKETGHTSKYSKGTATTGKHTAHPASGATRHAPTKTSETTFEKLAVVLEGKLDRAPITTSSLPRAAIATQCQLYTQTPTTMTVPGLHTTLTFSKDSLECTCNGDMVAGVRTMVNNEGSSSLFCEIAGYMKTAVATIVPTGTPGKAQNAAWYNIPCNYPGLTDTRTNPMTVWNHAGAAAALSDLKIWAKGQTGDQSNVLSNYFHGRPNPDCSNLTSGNCLETVNCGQGDFPNAPINSPAGYVLFNSMIGLYSVYNQAYNAIENSFLDAVAQAGKLVSQFSPITAEIAAEQKLKVTLDIIQGCLIWAIAPILHGGFQNMPYFEENSHTFSSIVDITYGTLGVTMAAIKDSMAALSPLPIQNDITAMLKGLKIQWLSVIQNMDHEIFTNMDTLSSMLSDGVFYGANGTNPVAAEVAMDKVLVASILPLVWITGNDPAFPVIVTDDGLSSTGGCHGYDPTSRWGNDFYPSIPSDAISSGLVCDGEDAYWLFGANTALEVFDPSGRGEVPTNQPHIAALPGLSDLPQYGLTTSEIALNAINSWKNNGNNNGWGLPNTKDPNFLKAIGTSNIGASYGLVKIPVCSWSDLYNTLVADPHNSDNNPDYPCPKDS